MGFSGQSATANRQGVQVMNMSYTKAEVSDFQVEYRSFNIIQTEEDALLTWSIETEENSNFYEVERSLDGENYMPVGRVTR